MKPYRLSELLESADNALIWVVGILEQLALATDSEALWGLVLDITAARVAWAHRNDTTPDTGEGFD